MLVSRTPALLSLLLLACGSGSSGNGASDGCDTPSKGTLEVTEVTTPNGEASPLAAEPLGCTDGHRELGPTTRFVTFSQPGKDPDAITLDLAYGNYDTGVKSIDPYGLIDPGRYGFRIATESAGFEVKDTSTGTFEITHDGAKARLEGTFNALQCFGCDGCTPASITVTGSFHADPYDG